MFTTPRADNPQQAIPTRGYIPASTGHANPLMAAGVLDGLGHLGLDGIPKTKRGRPKKVRAEELSQG